jgi:hypothetical protein
VTSISFLQPAFARRRGRHARLHTQIDAVTLVCSVDVTGIPVRMRRHDSRARYLQYPVCRHAIT